MFVWVSCSVGGDILGGVESSLVHVMWSYKVIVNMIVVEKQKWLPWFYKSLDLFLMQELMCNACKT